MKHISIRLPEQLYEEVVDKSKEKSISVSEFARSVIASVLTQTNTSSPQQSIQEHTTSIHLIDTFTKQLKEKDNQISEANRRHEETQRAAEDASKRHDTIILQMTEQLDRANLQIEDMRPKQNVNWWTRMFSGAP